MDCSEKQCKDRPSDERWISANVHEAIEACLDVEVGPPEQAPKDQILEIAL